MSKRSDIKFTVVDRLGPKGCLRGHKPGDSFDYDTERGQICPMALHCGFPYIDILRYGGTLPANKEGEVRFCCSDADTALIFKLEQSD